MEALTFTGIRPVLAFVSGAQSTYVGSALGRRYKSASDLASPNS